MKVTFRNLAIALLLISVACSRKGSESPALSPQEALKRFHLNQDFRIELFASEPEVMDPVEMVFDENGKVYVAEMRDYPEDPPPGRPARSRIRLLEDTDGDGKIDRSSVFADEVLEVSGILPWKGGLIVTSAPDILFMKDTNGDGRADLREVLYTGFPKVNPEARVTNPRLGIDNWVYVANDGQEGQITSPAHPGQVPIRVGGADFRFRPDRGLAEAASGPTQFGMTFDKWGNRFITQNTIHTRHVVVPMQYLARAPLLEVPTVSQDISDHGRPSVRIFSLNQPQEWKVERTELRQQRYRENHMETVRQLDPSTEMASGYFTAAAGGTIYSGDTFPEQYHGNLFTGDVSANLIHRDLLRPDGVTFLASRDKDEQEREFLASTDIWFRPCNFANSPDGNLYVIDMYRLFIETPESIPDSIKRNMNFWSGDTLGRIYRIVPNEPRRKRDLQPKLGSATTAQLVKELENTNGWHRQTAQRLLVEGQDSAAVPLLKNLAEVSPSPLARVHALWTLEGLSALEPALVMKALKDPQPEVREHALRLSEPLLPESKLLSEAVLGMVRDPDLRVQFQLAFALGKLSGSRPMSGLAEIATQHGSEQWFRIAVLSSVHDSAAQFFQILLEKRGPLNNADFLFQLASLIGGKHDPGEIGRFLNSILSMKQPEAGLSGLAQGMKVAGVKALRVPGAEGTLRRFLDSPSEPLQKAAWETARYLELRGLVQKAAVDAVSGDLTTSKRINAIGLLRSGSYSSVAPVLSNVLESHGSSELQVAAIDSLASFDDPGIATTLISQFRSLSPEARKKTIELLMRRHERVPILVKALEEQSIELSAIETAVRARLLEDSEPDIAQRARRLFQNTRDDRTKLIESYRDVLQMVGDRERGKKLFDDKCAKCHMQRRQGGRVGPDLSGVNNKTKEELLTSILNPSYAIEPRFTNYLVRTKDGTLHDGIIASETPGAITLRGGSEEGDETILRENIVQIRASTISLMPDDLEKSMTHQGLADVISYLRGGP
jgi:putative membrane-bound dehydrogenase-like protein